MQYYFLTLLFQNFEPWFLRSVFLLEVEVPFFVLNELEIECIAQSIFNLLLQAQVQGRKLVRICRCESSVSQAG
jgi:hypothetical protein